MNGDVFFFITTANYDSAVDSTSTRNEYQEYFLGRGSYDFHIAGNGLYTMLVTTMKDSKTSKHISVLYQL